jgi:hypothetical protein
VRTTALACGSISSVVLFSLAERKNEPQKEEKVPLHPYL